MIIVLLILFGLCLGSFVNALVWRVHKQSTVKSKKQAAEYSIAHGRSMCTDCGHQLGFADLVPALSWLVLRGKCRYCHKRISWQYPAVEMATAALFIISYVFWPRDLTGIEIGVFSLWLAVLVGLMALLVYDLRWMLLPNRIVFPLYYLAGGVVILRLIQELSLETLANNILAVAVGGGIFYVLFQISAGRWIGGGDVKLGFLLGAFVGTPVFALLMLFVASLLGCIVSLPLLLTKSAKKNTRIPFGPFLIMACVIVMLWGQRIVDWYLDLVLI